MHYMCSTLSLCSAAPRSCLQSEVEVMHWTVSTAHARRRHMTHLQAGAHRPCNVIAGDLDHDVAPLGFPHIHRQCALLYSVKLEVGALRPGAGGAYSASPPYCSSTA